MRIKDVVLEFAMVTCYNAIMRWYTYTMYVWKTIQEHPLPIQLGKVEVHRGDGSIYDVTEEYLTNNAWEGLCTDQDTVHVQWSFDNKKYRYYYDIDDPIQFPPYTIEQLRNEKPTKRIAALSINKTDDESFELVSEYAGPMCDFYGRECNLAEIVKKPVESVSVIDNKGNYVELTGGIMKFNA